MTAEEYELMKTHTIIGFDTLNSVYCQSRRGIYLKMAADIARSHHERWDGSGYPDGLGGEEIPLAARIVALADVYDALVSERVYKPPFTHEVAREIITNERGMHFDPDVVDAFLLVENNFRNM